MKTFRFKLYKSERNEKLNKQINAAGLIYNHCIAQHKRYYKIFCKYLNKNQLQKPLVKLKKMPKFSYIKELGSQATFLKFESSPPNFNYETICIEDLNVKEMQRLYGKKISDLAFSEFVNILKNTASKFDVNVVEVDRYFASSQICHCCNYKNPAVKDLNVRKWICPKCGTKHDRDRNAATNILNFGLWHRPLQ